MVSRFLSSAFVASLAVCAVATSAHAGLKDRLGQRLEQRAAGDQEAAELMGESSRKDGLKPWQPPAGVRHHFDVAYGAAQEQRLDLYLPDTDKPAPVIFMVHGGGWKRGDKGYANVVQNKVMHWLPKGYAVVSVNYRMIPQADPLVQAEDVRAALRFVQQNADQWGLKEDAVVLMGHSAGAHLVAFVAGDLASRKDIKPVLGTVSLDSGGLDIVKTMEGKHFSLYDDAFGADSAFWKAASPVHNLSAGASPFLLVCSSQRKAPCPDAEGFRARAKALGVVAQVLPVRKSHGEINEQLGEDVAYTAQVDDFLSKIVGLKLAGNKMQRNPIFKNLNRSP